MDNRLIFAVLLVTLCWFTMGTNASTNSTSSTNGTASSNSSSTNATTAMPSSTNATSSSNSSSSNATTAMPSSTNATSSSNSSSSNTTSGTNNTATTANPSSNSTMSNSTTGSNSTATNATAAPDNPTTGTPSLTPNITVEVLQTNLSRSGCGTEQLCASEPSTCDPSGSGSCYFFSAKRQGTSGNNFNFGLSGQSDGYVAVTLSTDNTLGGNDTTYVCANNNGTMRFIPALLDNNALTSIPESDSAVNSVEGRINGNTIQCIFAATAPSSDTRSTNLLLSISTGEYNPNTGALGAPTSRLTSSGVDLTNPNATVTNELNNSTSNAFTFKQSLTQVLLVSAGMIGLAWL